MLYLSNEVLVSGRNRMMRRWGQLYSLVALLMMTLFIQSPQYVLAQTEDRTPQIVVLEASGPVIPPFGAYISRGVDEADRQNADAILLILDTPGGSVGVTLDVIQKIRTSDIPVIVFVGPRGSKAASAGLLITLAGHASAMAPDTAIGASTPIGANGEDLEETARKKAIEFLSAEVRSLAERRGPEAVKLAEEAIKDARAVTEREALDAGLVDFVAEDTSSLLAQLDGLVVEVNGQDRTLHTKDAALVSVPINVVEQVLGVFTDPNIVAALLGLGITLIIIEASAPGGWAAGAIGVTCVGLAIYGMGVLPVNWLGIVFVIMAAVLLILDVNAPTHGALTAAAVISLTIGLMILFSGPQIEPFGKLSIPLVIAQSIAIGVIFFTFVFFALKAQRKPPITGLPGMIGQTALVTQDIDPSGSVLIWGERWKAESADGSSLPAGTSVEVTEATGMKLKVKRKLS
jgi:membrane-bound serine protease (ClpP class)